MEDDEDLLGDLDVPANDDDEAMEGSVPAVSEDTPVMAEPVAPVNDADMEESPDTLMTLLDSHSPSMTPSAVERASSSASLTPTEPELTPPAPAPGQDGEASGSSGDRVGQQVFEPPAVPPEELPAQLRRMRIQILEILVVFHSGLFQSYDWPMPIL